MNWVEQLAKFAEDNGWEFYNNEDVDYMRYTTIRLFNPKNQRGYKHIMLTSELNTPGNCNRIVKEICYRAEQAL